MYDAPMSFMYKNWYQTLNNIDVNCIIYLIFHQMSAHLYLKCKDPVFHMFCVAPDLVFYYVNKYEVKID